MADAADESRLVYPSLTPGLLSLRAFPTSFFAICEIVSVMLISCAGPSTQFHETSGECTVLRFLSPNEAYLVWGDVAFFMKQSLFIFKKFRTSFFFLSWCLSDDWNLLLTFLRYPKLQSLSTEGSTTRRFPLFSRVKTIRRLRWFSYFHKSLMWRSIRIRTFATRIERWPASCTFG